MFKPIIFVLILLFILAFNTTALLHVVKWLQPISTQKRLPYLAEIF